MNYEVLVKNVCDANESHIEAPFARPEIELVGFSFDFGGLLVKPSDFARFNRVIFNPEYGFPESSCICDSCSKKR